ncbi:MAG: hypothetical protein L3J58_08940 [Emcibacter sp.]|nr:hypothetical protein [Emcibacter sp.]
MTDQNNHEQVGCCGGQGRHKEPKEQSSDCCHDKDSQKTEKDKSEHSEGCCGENRK